MFGIGMPEMILILAVALIVIGPKKLPELAKSLGKALGEFKNATRELKDAINLDGEVDGVKDTIQDLKYDFDAAITKENPELPGVYGESADAPDDAAAEKKSVPPPKGDGTVDPETDASEAKGHGEDD